MKVWFRCNKCGKAFEAEERVRTDICPHCMSFIDLSRAERLVGKPAAAVCGKEVDPAADAASSAMKKTAAGAKSVNQAAGTPGARHIAVGLPRGRGCRRYIRFAVRQGGKNADLWRMGQCFRTFPALPRKKGELAGTLRSGARDHARADRFEQFFGGTEGC